LGLSVCGARLLHAERAQSVRHTGVEFLAGGAPALGRYAGILRDTSDGQAGDGIRREDSFEGSGAAGNPDAASSSKATDRQRMQSRSGRR
jgi:hypothetical protein